MTKPTDDLDAVRAVSGILESFDSATRTRIIRWALEKLGTPVAPDLAVGPADLISIAGVTPTSLSQSPPAAASMDLRTFVQKKTPRSATQLAAVIAYYYRFVAPQDQRRDDIGKEELMEGCRLADQNRPKYPSQTLVNAYREGLLDRAESGRYRISTVGENLVAMVLEGAAEAKGNGQSQSARKRKPVKTKVTPPKSRATGKRVAKSKR